MKTKRIYVPSVMQLALISLFLLAGCASFYFSNTPEEWHAEWSVAAPAGSDLSIAILAAPGFPGLYRTVYLVQQAGYRVQLFYTAEGFRSAGVQPDLLVILDGQGGHSPSDALHNINGFLTLISVGIIPVYSRYSFDAEIVMQGRNRPQRSFGASVGERSFPGWIPWLVALPSASYSSCTGRSNWWHVGRMGALDFRDDLARGIIAEVRKLDIPAAR